jgi:Zn-finger nucleic acid-binding protein
VTPTQLKCNKRADDTNQMTCPACGRALTPTTVGQLTVDACAGGCGGIWFDHYELKKVDEPMESVGEALLDVPRDPALEPDRSRRYGCPKCTDGVVMMRHFESVKRLVTLDECPECGGVFLDPGELGTIRTEFPSEEARHAAADAYFSELFDGQLAAVHAETMADLERSKRFAHAFRFISPSWYLPGKQSGGAF